MRTPEHRWAIKKSCPVPQHGRTWGALCRVESVRERPMPYHFTYVWNLKKQNEQNGDKLRGTEGIWMVSRWEGGWRVGAEGTGMKGPSRSQAVERRAGAPAVPLASARGARRGRAVRGALPEAHKPLSPC